MNQYSFDEITIGMTECFEATITETMQEQFTQITKDVNPMHMTDDYAKAHGYERRLVYGMLTSSLYSTLVGVYLPGEHCIFHEISTTFNSPVYIGDQLTITGKVIEIDERFRRIKIKGSIVNQDGIKVSRATLAVGFTE